MESSVKGILLTGHLSLMNPEGWARVQRERKKEMKDGNGKKSDNGFRSLYDKAHEAGMKAGEAATPIPRVFQRIDHGPDYLGIHLEARDATAEDVNLIGVKVVSVTEYYEEDGYMGFASITVPPCDFADWLVANELALKTEDGANIWVDEFDQSFVRKTAYAAAFVCVLGGQNIEAVVESRLD